MEGDELFIRRERVLRHERVGRVHVGEPLGRPRLALTIGLADRVLSRRCEERDDAEQRAFVDRRDARARRQHPGFDRGERLLPTVRSVTFPIRDGREDRRGPPATRASLHRGSRCGPGVAREEPREAAFRRGILGTFEERFGERQSRHRVGRTRFGLGGSAFEARGRIHG